MSDLFNNATTTIVSILDPSTLTTDKNRLKFGILLALQLLSAPCYLFVFYQFYRKRQLRESNHHHVVALLLIVSFLFLTIALSLTLAYMYTSTVRPASDTFCSIWTWIHYSLNIVNLFLMSFANLERNWLIFHPWLVRNKVGLILLHYCPLAFCVLYPPIFYFIAIFVHQCESYYDYTQLLCLWPCYFSDATWANFDLFFNNYMPLFSIPVFCVAIYVRVCIQKRTMKQQAFKWRRDKKMIVQLWAISSLYLAMWMPLQLTSLIDNYWDPNFLIQAQVDYIWLFPYLIHLIYPYVILTTYWHAMVKTSNNRVNATMFPTQF